MREEPGREVCAWLIVELWEWREGTPNQIGGGQKGLTAHFRTMGGFFREGAHPHERERAGDGAAEVGEPVERVESLTAGDELLVEFVEGSGEREGDNGGDEESGAACAERSAQGGRQRTGAAGEEDEMEELVLMGEDHRHALGRGGSGEEKQDGEPYGEQGPEKRGAAQDRG